MDEDAIDFNDLRDNLRINDQMRKLSRTRNYTDRALDKSIFNKLEDKPEIYFSMTNHDETERGLLTNVELSRGILGIDYAILETKFNRLMLPIYRVQADVEITGFGNTYFGFINGVLRPTIQKGLERVYLDKPELHFYFEDPKGDLFYGKSITTEKNNLMVILKEWDKADYRIVNDAFLNDPKKLLPAWFEALINPNDSLTGNFERK